MDIESYEGRNGSRPLDFEDGRASVRAADLRRRREAVRLDLKGDVGGFP